MGLVIGVLALLVSLTFNLLQLKWRNEGRAERAKEKTDQERKDQDKEAEQRSREQAHRSFTILAGLPAQYSSAETSIHRDSWTLPEPYPARKLGVASASRSD